MVLSNSAAADDPPAGKAPAVTAPPESVFARFRESDREPARRFYSKFLEVKGIAGPGLGRCRRRRRWYGRHDIVTHLLAGRPDILEAMVKRGTRLIIIGKDQVYTDMPEYRNSPNPAYQNERVRGTGGLAVTSFGEENLLNLAGDRYDDESIAVHEFCHTIDAALGRHRPRRGASACARPTRTRSTTGCGRTPMPAPTRANTGPRSASPTSTATGSTTGTTPRSAPASSSSSTTPRATTWSGRPSG